MTLISYAVCMASSAPNPYGQPQAQPTAASSSKIYYTDNFTQPVAGLTLVGSGQQATHEAVLTAPAAFIAADSKSLVHSSLLANYDGYIGGMSSDSELTTSGATRHHHHHHHHRPYSSQSRVYHVHPAPKSSPRQSHYSDSGPHVQSLSSPSSGSHSIQQQQLNQQVASVASPTNPISLGHQGSISSSGSASSAYLTGVMANESPISTNQQQATRPAGSRQLPQRPFKQSMSIDHHHSLANQYQYQLTQVGTHSPAHHSSLGSHRNLMEASDQQAGYQKQQQNYSLSQLHSPHQYGVSPNQRNLRLEMELMEEQAANLKLYDTTSTSTVVNKPVSGLPPTGPVRPSSSTSVRQLPHVSSGQSSGLMGSMSLDQQHHQVDPFHQQQKAQQQLHQDSYPTQHQQISSSSADWLPPIGLSGQHHLARSNDQFKQTMSIDHYPMPYANRHHQQQQQQQHFSPVRTAQHPSDQYQSMSGYTGQSLIGGYDSPTHRPHHYQQQQAYYSQSSNTDRTATPQDLYYTSTSSGAQIQQHIETSSGQRTMSSDFAVSGKQYDRAGSSGGCGAQLQQVTRPSLQHQASSGSSNSNLSGSLKSTNIDHNNLDKQISGEHQKSISSASSSHYHQSPQHNKVNQYSGRQDMLRRGYTSVAITSAAGHVPDIHGSQGALSESGDLSLSQASNTQSGQLAPIGAKRSGLRAASPSIGLDGGASSSSHLHHQHQSSLSSHGVRDVPGIRSESSTGLPNGSGSNSTLTKKSNSATQLSMTGTKKRLGFRKKQVTSFSVHRSEEVAPLEARHLVKQGSSVSEGDSSMSGDSSSRSWSNSNFKQQTSEELASMSFIDGLGKGQMISRQGLASPYLGDIQLSLCDRRGNLEVEIIRARNLQAKTNKILPLTYVKLYLVKNRKCLAKAKTTLSNKRTLNPLFQQQLTFHEDYHGCILQSIVWGNFGKMDKKNFMGIAQISIDDLELSDTVISWYKLFLPSSLQTLPSKSLRHTLLSNSTESFTTTNNS